MPQSQKWVKPNLSRGGLSLTNVGALVAQAGLTDIAVIQTTAIERVFAQIEVQGKALDQFQISGRAIKGGTLTVLYQSSADFTQNRGILIFTTGDLTNQAAGTTGAILLETLGFYEIVLSASSADVAGSTVNVSAGGA